MSPLDTPPAAQAKALGGLAGALAGALVALAVRLTGWDAFDAPEVREGLAVLLASLGGWLGAYYAPRNAEG